MSKRTRKLYDLTPPFGRDTPTYAMSLATYNPPMIATYTNFEGTPLRSVPPATPCFDSMLCFFSHTGTHLDAPAHFTKGGWTVDQIPLDYLVNDGVVVDMPKGELEEIGPKDLENAKPKIETGDTVVIDTGWHKHFCGPITNYQKAVYYATKNPGIVKEGVDWLIKKRVKAVMVDYIGVDHIKHTERGDDTWPAHRNLGKNKILMVQVLGGQIDEASGKRCTIIMAPIKYAGGDGIPVRVLAMMEE